MTKLHRHVFENPGLDGNRRKTPMEFDIEKEEYSAKLQNIPLFLIIIIQ